MRLNKIFIFGMVLLLGLLTSCNSEKLQIYRVTGPTMGTTYHIKYLAPSGFDEDSVKKDIEIRLDEVNKAMSTYIKDSEISLFNKMAKNEKFYPGPDFTRTLTHALEVARKTDGTFDPTIGTLVNLWGFGPNGKRKIPSKEDIAAAKNKVGFEKIIFKDGILTKSIDGVYLDLSASAKGFGVDAIIELLQARGIKNALVEVGGEVRTMGESLTRPWRIGVESPSNKDNNPVVKVVKIKNVALATSGDYRNFFKEGGKRYQHTINFKSGSPVESQLASVSVISDTCMDADAWATALMAMGAKKAIAFAKENKLKAFFIYRSDDGSGKYLETSTPGFDKVTE
ncbi:FAD:protein FMN transferase [Halobacteriovorax sp. GFR7]|uniref:FAD:protein FMN transferase n=1 Tax=unclassified Halobacteriovorax TaxID=2639665 RepID=UPI003719FF81